MLLHLLAVGDVVAQGGLDCLHRHLRRLKKEHDVHFTVDVYKRQVLGLINTPGRSGPWKDRLKRADIRLGKDCPTDDVFLLGCPYCRHAEVRPAGHTSIRCLPVSYTHLDVYKRQM